MSESGAESLLQAFCLYKDQMTMLFTLCVVLLGLSLVTLVVVRHQTAGYFVSVVNVVTLTLILLPLGVMLWYCRDVE